MSFTYSTLKSALKDYTQNDETSFVSNLPLFIRLAEERILKAVQLSVFEKNASGNMTASNQYLACPSDFLASNSLTITNSSNYEFLQFKELEFVQSYNPNAATTGTPKYYAQFDVDHFIIAPTPDTGYTVDLSYFYRPASLTTSLFQLTLTSVSGTFTTSDTITGGTSGETSDVSAVPSSTILTVQVPSGDFTVGETITGSSSGATGTLSSIGSDSTVSWISENGELALLYGGLIECYIYMKGEQDVMTMYNSRFAEALARLKNLGEAKEVTDEYVSGPIRKART
jgi:hypothetical protein|tara:strand:+ start:389 stop:1243 length:855 start_codon:yes stop_codon:yes gene_type:complete